MTSPCEVPEGRFTAEDGYTYASAAERLLGRPEKTDRNVEIHWLRAGGDDEATIERYWRAYDRRAPVYESPDGFAHGECHRAAYDEATGRNRDDTSWPGSPGWIKHANFDAAQPSHTAPARPG